MIDRSAYIKEKRTRLLDYILLIDLLFLIPIDLFSIATMFLGNSALYLLGFYPRQEQRLD